MAYLNCNPALQHSTKAWMWLILAQAAHGVDIYSGRSARSSPNDGHSTHSLEFVEVQRELHSFPCRDFGNIGATRLL